MANKKLGTTATELRLPTKKVKGEKKPKWQAKTGGKKAKEVEVAELVEATVETPVPVMEQPPETATQADTPNTNEAIQSAPTAEPAETQSTDEPTPATVPEPTTEKPKKSKPTSGPRSSA